MAAPELAFELTIFNPRFVCFSRLLKELGGHLESLKLLRLQHNVALKRLESAVNSVHGHHHSKVPRLPIQRLTNRIVYLYTIRVIKSYRHKGLKRFAESGSKAGIQPKHADRLRRLLTALDVASVPQDMDAPGNKFHPLEGDLARHWAVSVSGNWRLTFSFDGEDAIFVDYQDYH